ncbi:MAG: beta strand repeat-containing protein [Pontimonas sp.]
MGISIKIGGGAASVPAATSSTAGKVRLATNTETVTGTATDIAVTPAGVAAALAGIVGGMTYKGFWDAITAVPDLSYAKKGDFYYVSGAGTRYGKEWAVGDHLVVNEDMGGTIDGAKLDKIDSTESISALGDLVDVVLTSPSEGQALTYDNASSTWINTTLDIGALQTELDDTQVGAGLGTDGAYTPPTSSNYLASATSLKNADSLLDAAIYSESVTRASADTAITNSINTETLNRASADTTLQNNINAEASARAAGDSAEASARAAAVSAEASTRASADSAIQAELDATQVGAGLNTDGSYSAPTSSNYLASATSLKNADSLLDTQLKSVADDVATLGGQLVASVNTITPVAGDVTLTATDISGFATVATTGAYSDLSGTPTLATVATTGAYSDLSGLPTLGTAAALDVGTSANNVVQLDGTAKLPAVDGSQLTNVVSSVAVADITDVTITSVANRQVLTYDSASSEWINSAVAYADVTGTPTLATVATSGSYTDLSNTPTLGTAAALDVGTSANNVVQLDGTAKLPAVDGSQLTDVIATVALNDVTDVTITSAADRQVLTYDSASSEWINSAVAYADVTGTPTLATVATTGAYSDLSGAPALATVATTGAYSDLSGTPTLATVATTGAYSDLSGKPTLGTAAALDVGTSALNVVQLDASGKLPAVDGSQITGITSSIGALDQIGDVTITSVADRQVLTYDSGTSEWINSAVAYADVTGTPTLATVATTGAYSDLSGTPTLATVATTGAYSDLSGTPTLGTAAALDVGATIGDVVQLEDVGGNPSLPAVDGSQITGLDYTNLTGVPTSFIQSLQYITDQNALNLSAGVHYIMANASGTTKVLTVPSSANGGDIIRITNWGLGRLKLTTGGSNNTYLLSGLDIVGGATAGEVFVESKCTVDLVGFNYVAGGYQPAWGVYFISSIEINTKGLTTSGQAIVYNATTKKLEGGSAGDMASGYTPTNYTVADSKFDSHFAGIDTELGLKAAAADVLLSANNLSELADAATARTNLGLGTAALADTGTSAGNVVILEDVGGVVKLPAVDGSQLANVAVGANAVETASPSGTYTITTTTGRRTIVLLSPSASTAVTIPSAVTVGAGYEYTIKLLTNFALTLSSTQNIDDGASFTIDTQYDSYTFVSDGTAWWVI